MSSPVLEKLAAACTPVLLDSAIKAFFVLALAALVTLTMRRASAASRHLVWTLALVSLLFVPLLSAVLPGWQVLPSWVKMGTVAVETDAGAPPVPPPSQTSGVASPPAPILQDPVAAPPATPPRMMEEPASPAPVTPPVVQVAEAPPRTIPREAILSLLLTLWVLGALVAMAPLLLGKLSLRRLRRTAQEVTDGDCLALLDRARAQLRLATSVTLLASSRRSMPMIWGILRPTLLLPEDASSWTPARRWVVLLHELAHARRRDCLTRLVAQLACAAHWFNPLAWIALARLHTEGERACDDLVLAAGCDAPDYADHVLDIASNLQSDTLAAHTSIAMARPSRLEGRLLAILDSKRNRKALTRVGVLLGALAVTALVLPLASMRAAGQSDSPEPPVPAFTAQLPEGVTVELVGLGAHPGEGKGWWAPDGTPFAPEGWEPKEKALQTDPPLQNARWIVLRCLGEGDPPKLMTFSFDGEPGCRAGFNVRADGKGTAGYSGLIEDFNPGQDTATMRFAVACGDFRPVPNTDLVQARKPGTMGRTVYGTFIMGPLMEWDGDAAVTVTSNLSNCESRVRALDKKGDWHVAKRTSGLATDGTAQTIEAFDDVPVARIASLSLETHPVHWITFNNVSLRPGRKTEVEVALDEEPAPRNKDAGPIDAIVGAEYLGPDFGNAPTRKAADLLTTLRNSKIASPTMRDRRLMLEAQAFQSWAEAPEEIRDVLRRYETDLARVKPMITAAADDKLPPDALPEKDRSWEEPMRATTALLILEARWLEAQGLESKALEDFAISLSWVDALLRTDTRLSRLIAYAFADQVFMTGLHPHVSREQATADGLSNAMGLIRSFRTKLPSTSTVSDGREKHALYLTLTRVGLIDLWTTLVRHRMITGEYPASHLDLARDELGQDLPVDPYSDGLFGFARDDQGPYVYSAGPDDTGQPKRALWTPGERRPGGAGWMMRLPVAPPPPRAHRETERYFVRLVAGKDRMTFQGADTTWDALPELLEQVPEREHTVLEVAIPSEDMTVREVNNITGLAMSLARRFNFEYGSYIGVHPLGSKGSAPQTVNETGEATSKKPVPEEDVETATRTVVLPDVDREPVMLDLASGNVVPVPTVEQEDFDALAREIEKLGRGDLVFDHPGLVCVRGARADAPLVEKDAVPGFPTFEVGQLPFKITVTTREGRRFAVTVTAADDTGCQIEYTHLDAATPDDPTVQAQKTPDTEKVSLPVHDREAVMLDLASGELVPTGGDPLIASEQIGRGDLMYNFFRSPQIWCVRGTIADALEIPDQAVPVVRLPKDQPVSPLYKIIGEAPFGMTVTTHEGRRFAVTVLAADGNSCQLEYRLLAASTPDGPAAVMEAFTAAVTQGRYEAAVALLSNKWPGLWGASLDRDIRYFSAYSLLWRSARSQTLSQDETDALNNFSENYLHEYLSSESEVRALGGRAAIITEGCDWLLLRTTASWRIAFGLYEKGGVARNAFLQGRATRDAASASRLTAFQFAASVVSGRYREAASLSMDPSAPVRDLWDDFRIPIRAVQRASREELLSDGERKFLESFGSRWREDDPDMAEAEDIRSSRAAIGVGTDVILLVQMDDKWLVAGTCFNHDPPKFEGFLQAKDNRDASPTDPAPRSWSDPIERFIRDNLADGFQLIDLDTGHLASFPDDAPSHDPVQQLDWFRESHMDAVGETIASVRGLVGVHMAVARVDDTHWDGPPNAIIEQLPQDIPTPVAVMSARDGTPATFGFRTREGGVGILQILEVVDTKPRGVRVRYKMVRNPTAVTNDAGVTKPAARIVGVGNIRTGVTVDAAGKAVDAAATGLKVPKAEELDYPLVIWLDIPSGDRKSIATWWLEDPVSGEYLGGGGIGAHDSHRTADGITVYRRAIQMRAPLPEKTSVQFCARVSVGNWTPAGRAIAVERTVDFPFTISYGIAVTGLDETDDGVRLSLLVPNSVWQERVFWARALRKDGEEIEPLSWNPGTETISLMSFTFHRQKLADLESITVLQRSCHEVRLHLPPIPGARSAGQEATQEIETGPASTDSRNAHWGNEIEPFVRDDGETQDQFIDLDTGKLFSSPEGFASRVVKAQFEWLRTNGIDAGGKTDESVGALACVDMVAVAVAPS